MSSEDILTSEAASPQTLAQVNRMSIRIQQTDSIVSDNLNASSLSKQITPSAKEALQIILELENDGSHSKFLAGHISESVIENQFLLNAEYSVDSDLQLNCEEHGRPAVFYSQQIKKWWCFTCWLAQESLVYIPKQYKKDMEDYERIKKFTNQVVKENTESASLISQWKTKIRQTLIKIRKEFHEQIDIFTNKFVRSLSKIEQASALNEFSDQDHVVGQKLQVLQNKYKRILKIFESIQMADQPEVKLLRIQSYKQEMVEIEAEVQAQDIQIKQTAGKVKKALKETVELDSLGTKALQKFFKYLQQKVYISLQEPIDTVLTNAKSLTQQLSQSSEVLSTLTKQQLYYDSEGKPSLYYIKPKSTEIYLYKESRLEFVGESLKFTGTAQPNPSSFSTCQLSNDTIYMIGGLQTTNDPRDFILLPYCKMIDANFNVSDKATMKEPRCNIALALIKDRLIIAIGGLIGRSKPCQVVSAYDTTTDVWFDCQSLTTARSNCSAIVLQQRYIYLMPGANQGTVRGNYLLIDYLDTGSQEEYNQANFYSSTYGYTLKDKKWQQLEINQQSFYKQLPVCGISLTEGQSQKVCIFGGQGGASVYSFQASDVEPSKGWINVKFVEVKSQQKVGFCQGSDTICKMYGSKLYALDSANSLLHIFDQALCQWSSNSLGFYKVPA